MIKLRRESLLRKNRQTNFLLRLKNHDMGQQQKRLEIAINKAQEVDRIKANFLATMSHELRTPLNGIIGFSEIIEMELRDEVYAPMAKTINLSGRRLLHTLNNLLDLSQVESNRLEVRYSIFRLAETISFKVNGSNMIISSIRFRNSGRILTFNILRTSFLVLSTTSS